MEINPGPMRAYRTATIVIMNLCTRNAAAETLESECNSSIFHSMVACRLAGNDQVTWETRKTYDFASQSLQHIMFDVGE